MAPPRRYMAADAIAAGTVVEVLPEFQAPPLPINVVYPSNRMLPPRVRAFVDMLAALEEPEPVACL